MTCHLKKQLPTAKINKRVRIHRALRAQTAYQITVTIQISTFRGTERKMKYLVIFDEMRKSRNGWLISVVRFGNECLRVRVCGLKKVRMWDVEQRKAGKVQVDWRVEGPLEPNETNGINVTQILIPFLLKIS